MSKIQSHSTDSHSDDCHCQSWVRDMVRVSDRETRTATVTETQSQLVACFYTVIYQSVFPTRTTSTPAATSSPSGRLAAYGSSWYGRIWPKSAPHSTSLSLDSIVYNAYRINSLMVRHNYVKSGQCSRRHLKRILSCDTTYGTRKSCLTGAIFFFFFSESAHRLGIGNWIILHFYSSVSLHYDNAIFENDF